MGMCRIVLADGTMMHLPAAYVDTRDGQLRLYSKIDSQSATFAPGVWAYWIWVTMSDPAQDHRLAAG